MSSPAGRLQAWAARSLVSLHLLYITIIIIIIIIIVLVIVVNHYPHHQHCCCHHDHHGHKDAEARYLVSRKLHLSSIIIIIISGHHTS